MKNLIALHALFLSLCLTAQVSVKRINNYYENYSYPKVIESLQGRSGLAVEIQRKLAESYKMTGDYKSALKNYAGVVTSDQRTPEDIYQYAQLLKMDGNYTEAQQQMDAYAALKPSDSRVRLWGRNKNYYQWLSKDRSQFVIKNLDINSAEQDFGVAYMNSRVLYTSSKAGISSAYRRWNGNGQPFLDLYIAGEDSAMQLVNVKKLSAFNKKYHEGPASYSKGSDVLIYTKENYNSKSADGVRTVELYESAFANGKRSEGVPFPLNNKEYSVAHPSISADGNTLYFASDMPGGKGGVDIYRATRGANGKWSSPENLGDNVNTEGNEVFPFFHESGLLFFSSDGRPGLGGLDIFVGRVQNGTVTIVINPGVPANSSKDDFTFVLNDEGTKGYFASNREGGKGDDDLYNFKLLMPFVFEKTEEGIARDKNGHVLAGRMIRLYDASGIVIDSVRTDLFGHYAFKNLDADQAYITGMKETDVEMKTLSGIAKDKKGKILAHHVVRLYDEFGNVVGVMVTDAKGRYVFRNLPFERSYMTEISEEDVMPGNITGVAKNNKGKVIALKVVRLYDESGNIVDSVITDAKGRYVFKNLPGERSGLLGEAEEDVALTASQAVNSPGSGMQPGYKDLPAMKEEDITMQNENAFNKKAEDDDKNSTNTKNNSNDKKTDPGFLIGYLTQLDDESDKLLKQLNAEIRGADTLALNAIYFDLDKYALNGDALAGLNRIISVLNRYPNMVMELDAHADCRGTWQYNMALSDNRANAALGYIRSKIIKPARVFGKGFGEMKLVNSCACEEAVESSCSEEEHALNRRVEFKIVRLSDHTNF